MKREPFLSKTPSNTELTFTSDITVPCACPVPAEDQQSTPMIIGKILKINKLEFAVAPPQSGSSSTDSRWNLEMLVFVEGGKPENPEKHPWRKDENQQQTQPTYDTGPKIEPGPH